MEGKEQNCWLSLISCEALTALILYLDKKEIIALSRTCVLYRYICRWSQIAIRNDLGEFDDGVSRAVPLDAWRSGVRSTQPQLTLNSVDNPWLLHNNEEVLSEEQMHVLLELSCLAAKRHCSFSVHVRHRNLNPPGNYLCSPKAHTLMPPHFHILLGQLSYPPVKLRPNAVEYARMSMMAEIEEEMEDEGGTIGGIHSKDEPRYYNSKQDLLNRIADTIEDQFTFCTKVLKFPAAGIEPQGIMNSVALAIQAVQQVQRSNVGVAPVLTAPHIQELFHHGITVVDNVLDPQLCLAVHQAALLFMAQTQKLIQLPPEELEKLDGPPPFFMSPGNPPSARGDVLTWIRADAAPGNHLPLSAVLERHAHIEAEVASLANLTSNHETQLALYPGDGRGYTRHRDAFPDDGSVENDNRKITAITYCNDVWNAQHGGRLRVWLSRRDGYQVVDVDPLPGRLVLFLSGVLDHEVQPTFHPRAAITSWFW